MRNFSDKLDNLPQEFTSTIHLILKRMYCVIVFDFFFILLIVNRFRRSSVRVSIQLCFLPLNYFHFQIDFTLFRFTGKLSSMAVCSEQLTCHCWHHKHFQKWKLMWITKKRRNWRSTINFNGGTKMKTKNRNAETFWPLSKTKHIKSVAHLNVN